MEIRHLERDDLDELLALYEHVRDSDLPLPEHPIVEPSLPTVPPDNALSRSG